MNIHESVLELVKTMTTKDAAAHFGVSSNAIGQWKRMKKVPMMAVEKYLESFNVGPDAEPEAVEESVQPVATNGAPPPMPQGGVIMEPPSAPPLHGRVPMSAPPMSPPPGVRVNSGAPQAVTPMVPPSGIQRHAGIQMVQQPVSVAPTNDIMTIVAAVMRVMEQQRAGTMPQLGAGVEMVQLPQGNIHDHTGQGMFEDTNWNVAHDEIKEERAKDRQKRLVPKP